MKKVLIVDDEELFLVSLTEGLSTYADEFTVLTATNGKHAIDILTAQPIDMVVSDLMMPVMDGFELLAQMVKHQVNVPVIVMTALGTPEIEENLTQFNAFGYLEKPIDFQMLADKIRSGLMETASGHIHGITLFSFLQLLEMEKKTCTLKVKAAGSEGSLHIVAGEIINAVCEGCEGEAAAYKILSWDNPDIEIASAAKRVKQLIETSLSNLLMEAMRLKDEGNRNNAETDWLADALEDQPLSLYDEMVAEQNHLPGNQMTAESLAFSTLTNNIFQKEIEMANVNAALEELMKIEGAMAAAVVDSKSGMALGTIGGGLNLEVAAAGNSEVVRSKEKVMTNLGLNDKIEDILITLGTQYHLIRPLATARSLFIYTVFKKDQANLAMARHKLAETEKNLEV
jgi:DNA-binding response OmpR family regulator